MAAARDVNEENMDWVTWFEENPNSSLMKNLTRIAGASATEMVSVIRTQLFLSLDSTDGPIGLSTESAMPHHPSLINDLIKEFLKVFSRNLETELMIQNSISPNSCAASGSSAPTNSTNSHVNGFENGQSYYHYHVPNGLSSSPHSHQHEKSLTNSDQSQIRDGEDGSDNVDPPPPPQVVQVKKPFYRRLSFRGFRKGRFFHKQLSDEVHLSSEAKSKREKHSKSKLAKIIVECPKEGIVHYISGESMDGEGTQQWDKCRLVLVKTAGGFMLEFYSPPKSLKPKSGVFCFLITEARETTALEMPDRENTFVLKAENNTEYVIEATNAPEMNSWLSLIKYSMRSPSGSTERPIATTTNQSTDTGGVESQLETTSHSDDHTINCNSSATPPVSVSNPPQLPPRLLQAQRNSTERENPIGSTSANSLDGTPLADLRAVVGGPPPVVIGPVQQDTNGPPARDVYSSLQEYPWFHGTLSRSEAARLVLQDGLDGHGTFLVRQSETRTGEFVLTFNFQGKAKHLRMTLSPEGQCRVQHLWFQSVFDMLEHFRLQPIPLESGGGTSDVTLTEFVVALPSLRGLSQSGSDRSRTTLEHQTVMTHNGSVRTRSESMERLQREQSSGGMSRAIENTYSFV